MKMKNIIDTTEPYDVSHEESVTVCGRKKENQSLADFISREVPRGKSGGDEFTTLVKFSPNII